MVTCGAGGDAVLTAVPAGVRQERGQLLQEVHADPRRHVQRRAVLQGLQGEGLRARAGVPHGCSSVPGSCAGVLCRGS